MAWAVSLMPARNRRQDWLLHIHYEEDYQRIFRKQKWSTDVSHISMYLSHVQLLAQQNVGHFEVLLISNQVTLHPFF